MDKKEHKPFKMRKFLWVPNFVWAESRLTIQSAVNAIQFLPIKEGERSQRVLPKQKIIKSKGEEWIRKLNTGQVQN